MEKYTLPSLVTVIAGLYGFVSAKEAELGLKAGYTATVIQIPPGTYAPFAQDVAEPVWVGLMPTEGDGPCYVRKAVWDVAITDYRITPF